VTLRRLGMIGVGGMAETVLTAIAEGLAVPLDHFGVVVRSGSERRASALLERVGPKLARTSSVHTDITGLLAHKPDAVVECAGHAAVRQYGETIFGGGCDFVVISIGALADDMLRATLLSTAQRHGVRLVLPSGAVGGLDALGAARLSGLQTVTYTGRKPPAAWRGTPAERVLDLAGLAVPAIFFEGSARQAATDYPQNANVAAAVALAGLGFDATKVRLIADPKTARNVHEVSVRAGCGDFDLQLEGRPSPLNAKTSLMAGFSVAREILNRTGALVI
jgi:aspartate dehydrogenase